MSEKEKKTFSERWDDFTYELWYEWSPSRTLAKLAIVAVGIFGVAEVISQIEAVKAETRTAVSGQIKHDGFVVSGGVPSYPGEEQRIGHLGVGTCDFYGVYADVISEDGDIIDVRNYTVSASATGQFITANIEVEAQNAEQLLEELPMLNCRPDN